MDPRFRGDDVWMEMGQDNKKARAKQKPGAMAGLLIV